MQSVAKITVFSYFCPVMIHSEIFEISQWVIKLLGCEEKLTSFPKGVGLRAPSDGVTVFISRNLGRTNEYVGGLEKMETMPQVRNIRRALSGCSLICSGREYIRHIECLNTHYLMLHLRHCNPKTRGTRDPLPRFGVAMSQNVDRLTCALLPHCHIYTVANCHTRLWLHLKQRA